MAAPQTYEEYLAQLNLKLNWFERFNDSLGGGDERLDLLNKILIELVSVNKLILAALSGTSIPGTPSPENPLEIATGTLACVSANTGYNFPAVIVPYDKEFVIKALSTNAGMVRVGNSSSEATDSTIGFPLSANEGISYKIKRADQIWISAAVAGEGVAWTVEK